MLVMCYLDIQYYSSVKFSVNIVHYLSFLDCCAGICLHVDCRLVGDHRSAFHYTFVLTVQIQLGFSALFCFISFFGAAQIQVIYVTFI